MDRQASDTLQSILMKLPLKDSKVALAFRLHCFGNNNILLLVYYYCWFWHKSFHLNSCHDITSKEIRPLSTLLLANERMSRRENKAWRHQPCDVFVLFALLSSKMIPASTFISFITLRLHHVNHVLCYFYNYWMSFRCATIHRTTHLRRQNMFHVLIKRQTQLGKIISMLNNNPTAGHLTCLETFMKSVIIA